MFVNIKDIVIPPDRQRKDLGEIETLKNSLQELGQIVPIILDEKDGKFVLVAGERRLSAAKALSWEQIEAKLKASLSDREKTLIELEENIRRKQLSWQEEVRAFRKFVALTKEPLMMIAKSLGMHPEQLSRIVTTADALDKYPKLEQCPSQSAAYQQYRVIEQRELAAAFEDLKMDLEPAESLEKPIDFEEKPEKVEEIETKVSPPKQSTLNIQAQNEDFISWSEKFSGKRFNFIHCDFPYGLNMGTAPLQNSSPRWDSIDERYQDSPEIFDKLCRAFFDNQNNFIADSAHCIFWLAHKNYGKLASRFAHYGWTVCETPLIWHKSDNAGIAPDPYRWPRRTYEIAIFASRGDRKIIKIKAASYSGPTTKDYHLSEKPLEMLSHFFEMVVDKHTEMLDPTCGGGTALQVAKKFGASRILGLDVNPAHVDYSNRRLENG
jgi:ParB family chromosome partitioning protein